MNQELIQTEAIVLRASSYEESGQIVSLFTESDGKLQALFTSFSQSPSKKEQERLSPLMRIETTLAAGKSSLHKGRSYALQDSYPHLRTSYPLLQTSCLMLLAIHFSQQGQKPAPLLYQLLTLYLKRLHELKAHRTGLSSFYLKVLVHEGLFSLEHFSQQSEEEQSIISFLATLRSWDALIDLILPSQLHDAISKVFHDIFDAG